MARGTTALLLALTGCAGDRCLSEDPSFQLDVVASAEMDVRSLEVSIGFEGEERFRRFNLTDELADGRTSLALQLPEVTSEQIAVDVTVEAFDADDAAGRMVATTTQRFVGSADGCNVFEVTLDMIPVEPVDADCRGNDNCSVTCPPGLPCKLDCRNNSTCTLDCADASSCELDCRGNAECILDCGNSPDCEFDCHEDDETCGGGVFACERECP